MTGRIKIELWCTTSVLLDEINSKHFKKKDVSQTYRMAMESSDDTDWHKVNKAIINRWSKSALKDIKEWAWSGKCWVLRG